MELTCPECKHEFNASIVATVPDEQKIVLELTLKDEETLPSAKMLGGVITANDKLLRAAAKGIGYNVTTFVSEMSLSPGKVRVGFLIVTVKPGAPLKGFKKALSNAGK